jgi:hypothetical protein
MLPRTPQENTLSMIETFVKILKRSNAPRELITEWETKEVKLRNGGK